MPAIVHASEIQRKPTVPDDVRTPARDAVADYIETEVLDEGRWPVSMVQLAEETGRSRTHVTNTLKEYFEPVSDSVGEPQRVRHIDAADARIPIPDDLDREEIQVYVRGWIQGYLQE